MRQIDRAQMRAEIKYVLKTYYPPGFKTEFENECKELGVKPTLANLYDLIVSPFKQQRTS